MTVVTTEVELDEEVQRRTVTIKREQSFTTREVDTGDDDSDSGMAMVLLIVILLIALAAIIIVLIYSRRQKAGKGGLCGGEKVKANS